jgi:hypothetical protein
MTEGRDLLGDLPPGVRNMVVAYLRPLTITLALARRVCKQWHDLIPAPGYQNHHERLGRAVRRLILHEADQVSVVASKVVRDVLWTWNDAGAGRQKVDFNRLLAVVALHNKSVLFSYFMRFPRKKDPAVGHERAHGVVPTELEICQVLLRAGSTAILASVIPMVWTRQWMDRVKIFWTNITKGIWPTLELLLDMDVVDLRKNALCLVRDLAATPCLLGYNRQSAKDIRRFASIVQGIIAHPKATNTDFFRFWLAELIANKKEVGAAKSVYCTAAQIVLLTGQKCADLCAELSKSIEYYDLHARLFHICQCDQHNGMRPEKRLKAGGGGNDDDKAKDIV